MHPNVVSIAFTLGTIGHEYFFIVGAMRVVSLVKINADDVALSGIRGRYIGGQSTSLLPISKGKRVVTWNSSCISSWFGTPPLSLLPFAQNGRCRKRPLWIFYR
jgi:hypothetical protein